MDTKQHVVMIVSTIDTHRAVCDACGQASAYYDRWTLGELTAQRLAYDWAAAHEAAMSIDCLNLEDNSHC